MSPPSARAGSGLTLANEPWHALRIPSRPPHVISTSPVPRRRRRKCLSMVSETTDPGMGPRRYGINFCRKYHFVPGSLALPEGTLRPTNPTSIRGHSPYNPYAFFFGTDDTSEE